MKGERRSQWDEKRFEVAFIYSCIHDFTISLIKNSNCGCMNLLELFHEIV